MVAVLAPLLVSSAALAGGKVKARILCGVVIKNKVVTVVPTPDNRRLDDPISCAVHVDSARGVGELKATVATDAHGRENRESPTGPIDADNDFEAVLKPSGTGLMQDETDYDPCEDFTINAFIEDAGTMVWQQKIDVTQRCPAEEPAARTRSKSPRRTIPTPRPAPRPRH